MIKKSAQGAIVESRGVKNELWSATISFLPTPPSEPFFISVFRCAWTVSRSLKKRYQVLDMLCRIFLILMNYDDDAVLRVEGAPFL